MPSGLRGNSGKRRATMGPLERQMGFSANCTFRQNHRGGPLGALHREVDPIIDEVGGRLRPRALDIGASAKLRIRRAFDTIAPILWPSVDVDRTSWLVMAASNDWNGLYPRDLYYEMDDDREILRGHFMAWIIEKCRTRARNISYGLVKRNPGAGGAVTNRTMKTRSSHSFEGDGVDELQEPAHEPTTASGLGTAAGPTQLTSPITLPAVATGRDLSNDHASTQSSLEPRDPRTLITCDAQTIAIQALSKICGSEEPVARAPCITGEIFDVDGSPESNVEESVRSEMARSQDPVRSRNVSTIPEAKSSEPDATLSVPTEQSESSTADKKLALFNALMSMPAHSRTRQLEQDLPEQGRAQTANCDIGPRSALPVSSDLFEGARMEQQTKPLAEWPFQGTIEVSSRQRPEIQTVGQGGSSVQRYDILERATLRINWNPPPRWNLGRLVNDYAEMHDCAQLEDFFQLIEARLPRKLAPFGGRIAELEVKMLQAVGDGPVLDCHMTRDDRGRAGLKQMLKKLRTQCELGEPELEVEVGWE